MRKVFLLAAIGFALPIASSLPAQALSDRTWVSGGGTNSGTCTRAAPCATFSFALGQTNAGGEINCVDAGTYVTNGSQLQINKAITISCEAGTAGVVQTGNFAAIVIFAPTSDVVTLRGLDIDGLGIGELGVQVQQAKEVHIEKCTFRNFRFNADSAGISTFNNSTQFLYIVDSVFSANTNGVVLGSGGGFKVASFKSVVITGSTSHGILLKNANAFVNITDSIISGNGGSAVHASASATTANVDRTTMANNATALNAAASGATIRSIGNNIFNNTNAVSIAAGATVATDGQNRSAGNTNTQAPNASVTLF